MELRFEAMLYSSLGNQNPDADYIKCSRGLQAPHPDLHIRASQTFLFCDPFQNYFSAGPP